MAEAKTQPTDVDPADFIATEAPEKLRADALTVLDLLSEVTGEKAVMWARAIIGYGQYDIGTPKKPQPWPLMAFSPRKESLTFYAMSGLEDVPAATRLGKYKLSGSCLHIKSLKDVDPAALKDVLIWGHQKMKAKYGNPTP